MRRISTLLLGLTLWGCSSKAISPSSSEPETLAILDAVSISSRADAEYFQRVKTRVDFGSDSVEAATLRVRLTSPCFPFEAWDPEQIPAGHNWPKRCDAFDRLIAVTLDPPADTASGPPGLELSRAVTPFGGPATFETDVTDFVNGLPGEHELQVDLGTWGDPDGLVSGSEGEWQVSVELTRTPGPAPRRVLAVVPLFNRTQTQAIPATVRFDVPQGTTWGRISYLATGHGQGRALSLGCDGPAEEFCRRTHTLAVDALPISEFSPWRGDCATLCTIAHHERTELLADFDYCQENPCGDMTSVRAARVNWCPGSAVEPHLVSPLQDLAPGQHEFTSSVDTIIDGGLWQLSATFFAYR